MCRDEICDFPLPSAAGTQQLFPARSASSGITERYTGLSGWYIKFHPDTHWGYLYYKAHGQEITVTSDGMELQLEPDFRDARKKNVPVNRGPKT